MSPTKFQQLFRRSDGMKEMELQQSLHLGRHNKLNEAIILALEFEGNKKTSQ